VLLLGNTFGGDLILVVSMNCEVFVAVAVVV